MNPTFAALQDFFADPLPGLSEPYLAGPPLTPALVATAETRLGYKLPATYLAVMSQQNGGWLRRCLYHHYPDSARPPDTGSTFALPILHSLGGTEGIDAPPLLLSRPSSYTTQNAFLIDQWGYPKVGVVICHFGHGGFLLDYSLCGPEGEPRLLHADAEASPHVRITHLAPTFLAFCEGLTPYPETA